MASLESLPSDQRAVLELVLRRGRSYEEIARLLKIDRAGVRSRALAALDALGPGSRVGPQRRALIADYLLGALPDRVADEVRAHLAQSPAERAWARVLAAELSGLATGPLPEIPGAAAAAPVHAGEPVGAPAAARAPAHSPGEPGRAAPAVRTSSRLGGAILLGIAAVIVIGVVLFLALSGSGKHHPNRARAAGASQAASTTRAASASTSTASGASTSSSTSTHIVSQINLKSPTGGKAVGVAEILRESGKTGIAIVAQGLTPNSKKPPNAYAVWLYNSPSDSHILGFVNPGVGSNGRLQTAGGLPTNASHYQKLLITLETRSNPTTPGTIVLEGALTGL